MISYEKPWLENGETLVCFGDSITASEDGYVSILTKKLESHKINVINAGRGGDKTPWALTRFQQDVLDRKPDAVFIYLGTNDSAIGRGQWADEPLVPPEAYKCNLQWMVHMCRLNGINKISLATPAWRFEGEAYRDYGDVMVPYCRAARDAADAMRCPLVPLDAAFKEEREKLSGHSGLLFTTDGTHMTEEGNNIIARTIIETWGMRK